MIELRWIMDTPSDRFVDWTLQYRYKMPYTSVGGEPSLKPFTYWSDWLEVPYSSDK